MVTSFPETLKYLNGVNLDSADPLDKKAYELISDEAKYERASQALRRRFVRGAAEVEVMDRQARKTKVRREGQNARYDYFVQGTNDEWFKPSERIWVVAMYALWQDKRRGRD